MREIQRAIDRMVARLRVEQGPPTPAALRQAELDKINPPRKLTVTEKTRQALDTGRFLAGDVDRLMRRWKKEPAE